MASTPSNQYIFSLVSGDIDWDTDTFSVILMALDFIFDPDTHNTYADVSANELASGNGYVTGGQNLTTVTVNRNDANDRTDVNCDDPTWNALGGEIGPTPGAVVFKDTGTPATSLTVGYADFGGNQTAPDSTPFVIQDLIIRAVLA